MSAQCGAVAGIDVHKSLLVVVVIQPEQPEEEVSGRFGTTRSGLEELVAFLRAQGVRRVAMESTAQYWRPVWMALEGEFQLVLTQARATRSPRGRKRDSTDARRIARRLLAGDLTISYVPGPEQREWRLLARTQVAMLEALVRLRNQIEVVLEQGQIKLSSVVSDVLGKSGRRILQALAEGEQDAERLAELGDWRLRASKPELVDALRGRLTAAQQLVLHLYLQEVDQIERHMATVERALAQAEGAHQDAIARLCEIPGISARSAQQIVAEIGPAAEAFDSASKLGSWVAVCPGRQESAGRSVSNRSAHGNRMMRRILSQIAWAAIASKGSEAQRRYRRWVVRMGPPKAAWAVAHYILRVIWKVLHAGVRYAPPDTSIADRQRVLRRANRVFADLKKLGYTVTLMPPHSEAAGQSA